MSFPTLEQRLEAHRDRMTPSVLRVARYLTEHPERALIGTAAEIADAVKTSDATVIRAVQMLGYAGLPELRRGVGEQLAARYDPRETLDRRVARVRNDPKSVLDIVIDDALTVLSETRSSIDSEELAECARLLAEARRIFVIGWGGTASAVDFTVLSLIRLGFPAIAETNSGFRLADSLAMLGPGDLVLVLAPLLHVREIDVTLSRASAVGARSVLVTELLGEKLRGQVDHVLTLASSQRLTVSEIVGLITVLDALLLSLAASDPARAQASWVSINALRREFSTGAIARSPLRDGR